MNRKWITLLLGAMLLLASITGCAASMKNSNSSITAPAAPAEAPMPAPDMGMTDTAAQEEAGTGGWVSGSAGKPAGEASPNYGGHKIIKTAGMGLETREFDADLAYIKQKVADMGGYVASSYVSGRKPVNYNDSGRSANLSLRLPQQHMDAFLADARGLATVLYENSGGEDITASYFDTQSRLEIYEIQRDRIKELLENPATPLEDRILIEQEMFRITYEIESLTTQLKRWDDLVDYSTITMELREIPPATMAAATDDDIGTRIREGLGNTFSGIAVFFENLLVFLIVASPVLLILAVIVVIIVLIARRGRRKRNNKPDDGYYQQPDQGKEKE